MTWPLGGLCPYNSVRLWHRARQSSVAFPSRPEPLDLLKVLPLLFLHFFIGHDFGQNVPVHFAGRNWSRRKKTPPVNRSLSSEVSENYIPQVFHSFSGPAPCRNQKDAHEATLQGVKDEALNPLRGLVFCCLARPYENKGPNVVNKTGLWMQFAKIAPIFSGRLKKYIGDTRNPFQATWIHETLHENWVSCQRTAPLATASEGLFFGQVTHDKLGPPAQVAARLILMCYKKRGKSPRIWCIFFARHGPWNSHNIDSGSAREEIFFSISRVDQIWWFLHLKNY